MKYKNGQMFISNHIMFESYEIVGFKGEKYNLLIYGEMGKNEDPIGKVDLTESDIEEHFSLL